MADNNGKQRDLEGEEPGAGEGANKWTKCIPYCFLPRLFKHTSVLISNLEKRGK